MFFLPWTVLHADLTIECVTKAKKPNLKGKQCCKNQKPKCKKHKSAGSCFFYACKSALTRVIHSIMLCLLSASNRNTRELLFVTMENLNKTTTINRNRTHHNNTTHNTHSTHSTRTQHNTTQHTTYASKQTYVKHVWHCWW